MQQLITSTALTTSILLASLQAYSYVCNDPQKVESWEEHEWQTRKFYRAWDWPLILTTFEFFLHRVGLESYVLHAAILGIRTAWQATVCGYESCPSGAMSPLPCAGGPCCGNESKYVVWSAQNNMCPLPPYYNTDCPPLSAIPDLTKCHAWGCSKTATPLPWFTVMWQTGTSAFLAVYYLLISRHKINK